VCVLKSTLCVPTLKLPVTARRRPLTTFAALTLTLAAAATSLAPAAYASPVPPGGRAAAGNDISWPQCPKGSGGYGLPGPQASAKFVVIGLTDGGSFAANPCLSGQVAAARARHLWTAGYAISTYPTRAELARYGGTGSLAARLARVGRAEARFNLATLRRVGLKVPMVWVDIEPRAKAPWSASTANNNAVIDGVLAGYKAAGVRAGVYSYDRAWKSITGGRVMPTMPTWYPVGKRGRTAAWARCKVASFSGTTPSLVQWTDGVRDYNLTCPGVTGTPASGSPLTRWMNVRLAVGSHGSAVVALQRRLGGLKADGSFGRLTKAKVVAFQRARHLRANGIVSISVWRALGAGIPYIPVRASQMRRMFAST